MKEITKQFRDEIYWEIILMENIENIYYTGYVIVTRDKAMDAVDVA